MKITFTKKWFEILKSLSLTEDIAASIDRHSWYGSDNFDEDFFLFTEGDLDKVYSKAKEINDRSVMMQISALRNARKSPKTAKLSSLKAFAVALKTFIETDHINYWIFRVRNGQTLPYLVTSVEYREGSIHKEEAPCVVLCCRANTLSFSELGAMSFSTEDVVGRTLEVVMMNFKILHETSELIEEFERSEKKFLEFKNRYHEQFYIEGQIISGDSRWFAHSTEIVKSRAINDEDINSRNYVMSQSPKFVTDGKLYPVPVHPFIYMFSLLVHQNVYVHINNVTEYVYDDSLREKIILPKEQADLLDILTQNLDILAGDIIEGKSLGTTILCKGLPGVGKTLTAEAYSEISHRPLYKVNSGQLGVDSEDVEKNLETILKRAERWGAAMLIDEADVYIRKRGNDMSQNAVVAAFLRTLEYFNGLLFLTTNREDDVDDAIASRCIATIRYTLPDRERRIKIWEVQSKNFDAKLSPELIEELADEFPETSGRDIKELLRLTMRFCLAKNIPLTMKEFISCAQFRGLTTKH